MKKLLPFLLLIAATLHAQLAPELAPLAAKHTADLAALDAQKQTALARYEPFYFASLDAAEKDALARSNLDAVAAIRQERGALQAGKIGDLVVEPYPEKLPVSLKSARSTLFDNYKHIEAELIQQRQRVNADYLRNLSMLEQKAAGNPGLAKQIKAESDAVLGVPVTTPEGEVTVATKTGKLINGDFTQADSSGFPVGWKLVNHNFDENAAPAGETFKVMQENSRSFLHTAFEQPAKDFHVVQLVDIPHFAREIETKFQVRGIVSKKGGNRWYVFRVFDENGKVTSEYHADFQMDSSWKTYSKTQKLDPKARHKQVRVELRTSNETGFIDWSHVELHFK